MNARHFVVVYGYDLALMKSRLLVLDSSGFQSHGVYSIAELIQILSTSHVDLVLLGHSLVDDDMRSALKIVDHLAKDVPVLRLAVFPLLMKINHETVLEVSKGPYRMIDAVRDLIQHLPHQRAGTKPENLGADAPIK